MASMVRKRNGARALDRGDRLGNTAPQTRRRSRDIPATVIPPSPGSERATPRTAPQPRSTWLEIAHPRNGAPREHDGHPASTPACLAQGRVATTAGIDDPPVIGKSLASFDPRADPDPGHAGAMVSPLRCGVRGLRKSKAFARTILYTSRQPGPGWEFRIVRLGAGLQLHSGTAVRAKLRAGRDVCVRAIGRERMAARFPIRRPWWSESPCTLPGFGPSSHPRGMHARDSSRRTPWRRRRRGRHERTDG
jgi:hypothetical protein